jgi:hypothetical protein
MSNTRARSGHDDAAASLGGAWAERASVPPEEWRTLPGAGYPGRMLVDRQTHERAVCTADHAGVFKRLELHGDLA